MSDSYKGDTKVEEEEKKDEKKEHPEIQEINQKKRTIVRCNKVHQEQGDIIFECGSGLGFAFTPPNGEAITYTPHKTFIPKTLGTIAIDTSLLKRPKTKVLFSCSIFFTPKQVEGTAQLEFVLSRSCNNSEEFLIGNWVYDIINSSERSCQTFRFNFCNCNSFPGCYNYFVRVFPVLIKNCSLCITNCHIDAFAQSM